MINIQYNCNSCFILALRLRKFYIRAGLSDDIMQNAVCYHQEEAVPGGSTVNFPCSGHLLSRVVSVDKVETVDDGEYYLELVEVEVYGDPGKNMSRPPLNNSAIHPKFNSQLLKYAWKRPRWRDLII